MPRRCENLHPESPESCRKCWLFRHHDAYRRRYWNESADGPWTSAELVPAGGEFRPARPARRRGYGDLVAWLAKRLGFRERGCGGCGRRRAWLNRWPTPADLWRRLRRRR